MLGELNCITRWHCYKLQMSYFHSDLDMITVSGHVLMVWFKEEANQSAQGVHPPLVYQFN